MKKIILLLLVGLFLSGCGTLAKESELWEHDTMYKNWDHLKFSLYGYTNPSDESCRKSQDQEWWGIEVPFKQ